MKVLDKTLDSDPSSDDVKEMVEKRVRNLLCFEELTSYNNTGTFAMKHPIVINKFEYAKLTSLWFGDRELFFKEFKNCMNNIYRYNGRLENKTLTDEKRANYEILLAKHTARSALFQSIVNGNFYTPCNYDR